MVRFVEDGGDESAEEIAPVIPLFGAGTSSKPRVDAARAAGWHSTWDAPGGQRGAEDDRRPATLARFESRERPPKNLTDRSPRPAAESSASEHELAEKRLLKKLRTRSLSLTEARSVLREGDLDAASIVDMIADFERRGYLDDAALAEQLVHSATDRRGQGRRAIAQTLAKRGVARDVADAAIAAMPDDDGDRALEFARTKARSLRALDHEVALRRLVGQLSRRGYPGSVALTAARTALSEA